VESGSYPLYLYWEDSITVDNCKQYFGDDATYPDAYLPTRMSDYITPRIAATLDAIKHNAPNAQVFVVGYPQIAPADATDACFSSISNDDAVPFSGVDLEFINTMEQQLDDALEAEAESHGFH